MAPKKLHEPMEETSESGVEKPCINARDNWMEEKK